MCLPSHSFLLNSHMLSRYLYETTFQKEVTSDLTGERGRPHYSVSFYSLTLSHFVWRNFNGGYSGSISSTIWCFASKWYIFNHFLVSSSLLSFWVFYLCFSFSFLLLGHSPSEAFNETVEEATQSLYPLIGAKGMDWMYANCSATGIYLSPPPSPPSPTSLPLPQS